MGFTDLHFFRKAVVYYTYFLAAAFSKAALEFRLPTAKELSYPQLTIKKS